MLPLRTLICPPKESNLSPAPPASSAWHRPLSQGTLCKPRFLGQLSLIPLLPPPSLEPHCPPHPPRGSSDTSAQSCLTSLPTVGPCPPESTSSAPVRLSPANTLLQGVFPDHHPETPPLPQRYPVYVFVGLLVTWLPSLQVSSGLFLSFPASSLPSPG